MKLLRFVVTNSPGESEALTIMRHPAWPAVQVLQCAKDIPSDQFHDLYRKLVADVSTQVRHRCVPFRRVQRVPEVTREVYLCGAQNLLERCRRSRSPRCWRCCQTDSSGGRGTFMDVNPQGDGCARDNLSPADNSSSGILRAIVVIPSVALSSVSDCGG